MTELAIQPRRRVKLWPILLLGLAAILALLWFLFVRERPPRMMLEPPEQANQPAHGVYAGTITSLATLVGPRDNAAMIGREVALEGVQVQQVLSDRAFLIGTSPSQRALVIFDPTAAPAGAAPPPKVDAGDTVAIEGALQPLPGARATQSELGLDQLTPAERAELGFHVAARTVFETVERSGTGTR